jgi:hypothetical protein
MSHEVNDPILWERLKNHTIISTDHGNFFGKNFICIRAKKRNDVTWKYTELTDFGSDLFIISVDGEQSYVSFNLYDFFLKFIEEKNSSSCGKQVLKEEEEKKKIVIKKKNSKTKL